MTDFRVVPDALRQAANQLMSTEMAWQRAADKTAGQTLGKWDLGIMGVLGAGDIPDIYNKALQHLADCLKTGAHQIGQGYGALYQAAEFFEQKDFEYYKQFGYVNERIDSTSIKTDPVQPPSF